MSDRGDGINDDLSFGEEGRGEFEEMPVEEPRRAASITLRPIEARAQRTASMEAANKSLNEALGITYRLIQLVMVVLVVLFAISGVTRIEESERGVRTLFGKISASDVSPGLTFAAPPPIGEVIRVNTGQRPLLLDDSFFFRRSPEEKARPANQLGRGPNSLQPGNDNALIMADLGLAHAEVGLQYTVTTPESFVRRAKAEDIDRFVRLAAESATVMVMSGVTVDELITPLQAGTGRTRGELERRIRELAQERLDGLGLGVTISNLSLQEVIPPRQVREQFAEVNTASVQAAELRQNALSFREQALNGIAGTASVVLLDLIDAYDAALTGGDDARAEVVLDEIAAVMLGERNGVDVEILGTRYGRVEVAGLVAERVARAERYRNTVAGLARARFQTFRAKLEQFRANPEVFMQREWGQAIASFMGSGQTIASFYPPETELVRLVINRDADIDRELQRERQRRQLEGNERLDFLREGR